MAVSQVALPIIWYPSANCSSDADSAGCRRSDGQFPFGHMNGLLNENRGTTLRLRYACEHQPNRRIDPFPAQVHNGAKNLRGDGLPLRAKNIPLVLHVAGAERAP